jgi:poly(3-hydroxybutyrate) depolymerase
MAMVRQIVLLLFFSLACGLAGTQSPARTEVITGSWHRNIAVEYEVGKSKHKGLIQIYFPSGYASGATARTLIVLHGWRQDPGDWERNTPIAEFADKYNFVLVCPAMRTTLYETKYYPETVTKWAPMPGGEYVAKILMEYIRKNYGLATERGLTGIFGISTGGRGALLLASKYREVFGAVAALSGDYDSVSLKNDRLLVSVYGPYNKNRGRWEDEVNIIKMTERLKNTPVFLGHGGRDSVVPAIQTQMMAERIAGLNREQGGYDLTYEREKSAASGHDWNYWAALVPDVMDFFDRKLSK